MVHVCLYEFQSFVLNHSRCLRIHHALKLIDLSSSDAFSVLGRFECLLQNLLDVLHSLSALSHPEAEVTEPFVIECDCPVFAEELYYVWNDSLLVSWAERVQVVLMKPDKTPQTLKDDFFTTHVGNRIDKTDAIESELDKVTFSFFKIKVVTSQWIPVLDLGLTWVQNQWICCFYVIINDITWKNTTLTLWKIETWKFFFSSFLVSLSIVDIENTSG